jgi:mannose-6-phosphate isomerase-like protein (cupin superfamily)
MSNDFITKQINETYDYLAPDGSEIRLLPVVRGGGLAHCLLPTEKISKAVRHQTVEEIWYVISGEGEVWRKLGEQEEVVTVSSGTSLTIPVGTSFQFRNTGTVPLCIIVVTIPPWPGPSEAVEVPDYW